MRRTLYDDDHEAFRATARTFVDKEILPHVEAWSAAGATPRELFAAAGRQGLLGMDVPEQYGGGGVRDFRFNAVLAEEMLRTPDSGAGLGISLHNDICMPYFLAYCTDEQKQRWLPGIVSGELITAIGMTEPGIGSDLASMATTAIRDGDHYVVNGAKTFITNGINADLVITAVRTSEEKHRGLTLLVVERGTPGFDRGRNLAKVGLHSQDTAELSFSDARVPVANRFGDEGQGFFQLVANLPQERMSLAIAGLSAARTAFDQTVAYVRERKAFGTSIGSFQNTRFVLAEIATEIDVAQAFVDQCVRAL